MDNRELLVEVQDNIATITINRPHARNAMTRNVTRTLLSTLKDLSKRDDARVIVLKGAGDKAFCAGHDLKEGRDWTFREHDEEIRVVAEIIEALATAPQPTIAQVRGYCMGGGCWLAASCDLVIAAEDAVFAIPQINFGIFEVVPMVPIMRSIGRRKCMELYLTADRINAGEAKEMGLVNRVVAPGELEGHVMELARKIASRSPLAVRMGKEVVAFVADIEMLRSVKYATNAYTAMVAKSEKGIQKDWGAYVERGYKPGS